MKNRTAIELFYQAEKLLQSNEYKSAAAYLQKLNINSLSLADKAYARLLSCEANLYLGNISIESDLQ